MVEEQKYLALEEECLLHHTVLEFKYQYISHSKETATTDHYNLQYSYTKQSNMQLNSLPADLGLDMKMVIQQLSFQFEVM
jgi:hypothetical protein